MAVELDITFYEHDQEQQVVTINLTCDDYAVRERFRVMAREMEENVQALLDLLTEEPNGFDREPTGGSNG